MYGPINDAGWITPKRTEDGQGWLCGNCQEKERASGDWLCKQCRAELEAQRQAEAETMPECFVKAFVKRR